MQKDITKYSVPLGLKIFVYLFTPAIIIGAGICLMLPLHDPDTPFWALWFIAPLSLGFVALFVLAAWDCYFGGLYISKDSVKMKSIFQKGELKIHEIKGFEIKQNYIYLIPTSPDKKTLKISHYMNNYEKFYSWLCTTFTNLDAIEEENELNLLLQKNEDETTFLKNTKKLKKAKTVTKTFNWIAGIFFALCFFYPNPYRPIIYCNMAIPFIAIGIKMLFGQFIRIDEKKKAITPTLFFPIFLAGFCLFIRALIDLNFIINENFWIIAGSIFLFFGSFVLYAYEDLNFKKGQTYALISSLLMCGSAYASGTTLLLNSILDESESIYYETSVIDKREDHDKVTTYTLHVEPWGPVTENDLIDVTKSTYDSTKEGDTISVGAKQGFFGITWYGAFK